MKNVINEKWNRTCISTILIMCYEVSTGVKVVMKDMEGILLR